MRKRVNGKKIPENNEKALYNLETLCYNVPKPREKLRNRIPPVEPYLTGLGIKDRIVWAHKLGGYIHVRRQDLEVP